MVHLGDWIFRQFLSFLIPWVLPCFFGHVMHGGSLADVRVVVPQLLTGHLDFVYLAECPHRLCIRKGVNAGPKCLCHRNSRLHHGLLSYLLLIARINKCIWGLETSR